MYVFIATICLAATSADGSQSDVNLSQSPSQTQSQAQSQAPDQNRDQSRCQELALPAPAAKLYAANNKLKDLAPNMPAPNIPADVFPTLAACKAEIGQITEYYTKRIGGEFTLEKAKCQERPKSEFDFVEIADGIHVHEGQIAESPGENHGDLSNISFVIGDNSVMVIDSGGAFRTGIETWLAVREKTNKPISHVLISHMHPDHIYGSTALVLAGANLIGHKKLKRAIADRASDYAQNYGHQLLAIDRIIFEPPTDFEIVVGKEGYTLELGNRSVHLKGWPVAHTNNDLTAMDEKTGTLFAGDLLFDQHVPVIDGSLRGWQETQKELMQLNGKIVVPGHGHGALEFSTAFENQSQYLQVLAKDAKSEIDKGTRLQDATKTIGQSQAEKWQLFEDFNPRNATVTYSELEWE